MPALTIVLTAVALVAATVGIHAPGTPALIPSHVRRFADTPAEAGMATLLIEEEAGPTMAVALHDGRRYPVDVDARTSRHGQGLMGIEPGPFPPAGHGRGYLAVSGINLVNRKTMVA